MNLFNYYANSEVEWQLDVVLLIITISGGT